MSTEQDERIAVDTKLVPLRKPGLVTVAMMKGFSVRVRLEGMMHAGAIVTTIEQAVVELQEGRAEGMEMAIALVAGHISKLQRFLDTWHDVGKGMRAMDPEYDRALAPVRFEANVLHMMATIRQAIETLPVVEATHTSICKTADGCALHEALRRLKERR